MDQFLTGGMQLPYLWPSCASTAARTLVLIARAPPGCQVVPARPPSALQAAPRSGAATR